ncbi:MAG: hypothetical protein JNK43_03750 [Ignavibacteria bacterium]|nr:hypothetical protein [Ignavibacteria bacterium]
MKTKLILIAVLFFIAESLYSQQEYISDANGFKITFPADWELEKNSGSMEVKGKSGVSDVYVVVKEHRDFKNKSISEVANDDFKNALQEQYSSLFDNLSVTNSGLTTFNGYDAYQFSYICDLFSDIKLVSTHYFLVHNSRLFAVTTSSTADQYPKDEKIINDILSTFAFTD